MKKPLVLLFVLAAILLTAAPRTANARVSLQFFYDSLDPYGEWVETDRYGYVFHPTSVDEEWSPYTDGYWAYTDAGWTWVSYEDFGAITYHYGRWVRVEDVGWCWVPDYEWGPAWVSWRSSESHIGWAPLPPECTFRRDTGISVWVDATYDIGPTAYSFCEFRNFGSPALRPVIIDRSRNVTIINETTNITNITVNNSRNVVFNGGPRFDIASRRSARPIQTLRLVQQTDVENFRGRGKMLARQQGNELVVLAPEVERPADTVKLKPAKVAKVVTNARIDKGWNKVQDPVVKQNLEKKIKEEAKNATPEQAPAKPVTESDLKVIDERVKAAPAASPASATETLRGKKGKPPVAAEPGSTVPAQPVTEGQVVPAGKPGKKGKAAAAAPGVQAPQPGETAVAPSPVASPVKTKGAKGRKAGDAVIPPAAATTAPTPGVEAAGPAPAASGKKAPKQQGELQPFTQPNAVPTAPEQKAKRERPEAATVNPEAEQMRQQKALQKAQQQQAEAEQARQRKAQQAERQAARQQEVQKPRAPQVDPEARQRRLEQQAAQQRQIERQAPIQRQQQERVVERPKVVERPAPQPQRVAPPPPRVVQPQPKAVAPERGKGKKTKEELEQEQQQR